MPNNSHIPALSFILLTDIDGLSVILVTLINILKYYMRSITEQNSNSIFISPRNYLFA